MDGRAILATLGIYRYLLVPTLPSYYFYKITNNWYVTDCNNISNRAVPNSLTLVPPSPKALPLVLVFHNRNSGIRVDTIDNIRTIQIAFHILIWKKMFIR
jgi:hypothetical protein